MENIQINGQKIWGPPRGWMGPPPPHGTEIYIKNLPDDVHEMELFHIFSIVGSVYEVRLPVHWSGINRGYAFVRFTKISEADEAIKTFDGFEIRNGRTVKIERSVDNTRLFLSCVPSEKNSDEIKKDLLSVVENVERVYVYPTLENPDLYRGYAFVEFKSHRDAAIAKRILTPDVCFRLFEKKCVAAWANPLPFLNENVLKTINILFMRNVPKEYKNITVKRAIENLLGDNSIQKVKRLNDFAFLTFRNHETAKAALNIIERHPGLLGGHKVQIEWAVPRELTNSSGGNLEATYESRRLNEVLHKPRPIVTSHFSLESKDSLQAAKSDSFVNRYYFSDLQEEVNLTEDAIVHKDLTYQKFWRDPKMGFPDLTKGHSDMGWHQFKGCHWDGIGIDNIDSDGRNESSIALRESFSPSVPVSPLEGSDGAWNLTPNSDIESEEPFRSPQTQKWLGNFKHSLSPLSPGLTAFPKDSSTFWNTDESNSTLFNSGNSKLQFGLEKLVLDNSREFLSHMANNESNLLTEISCNIQTAFTRDNFA